MTFEVTILGSNSALPAHGRHPTAQILNLHEHHFLIDCGEGTQIQFQKYGVKSSKIEHIFISHLHGDHFFGLIGLLTSYQLNHRQKPLHIHCPEGLEEIIEVQLKHSNTQLRFPLHFHAFEPKMGEVILRSDFLKVQTVVMNHRIPCAGFVFREIHKEKNIKKEAIQQYGLTVAQIKAVKAGEDITLPNGKVLKNSLLTESQHPERSYAFCTDTAFNKDIIPTIKGVDLLYHEATFDNALLARAKETFHCTTTQAATIAKQAHVKKLVIGHFSSRYTELEPLLDEARIVFPNTELGEEGKVFEV